jgi:hypothetical protein
MEKGVVSFHRTCFSQIFAMLMCVFFFRILIADPIRRLCRCRTASGGAASSGAIAQPMGHRAAHAVNECMSPHEDLDTSRSGVQMHGFVHAFMHAYAHSDNYNYKKFNLYIANYINCQRNVNARVNPGPARCARDWTRPRPTPGPLGPAAATLTIYAR